MGFLNQKQRKAVMAKLKDQGYSSGTREKVISKMEKQERGVVLDPYDSQKRVHSWQAGNYDRHLEIEKQKRALKPGKRITPNARIYYERRTNRSDKRPAKHI